MSSTIKLCKFCRVEIRVPFEAQRGIQCPACGNFNNYGGPPLSRHYNGNGPQHGGYQYNHPSLPPRRRPAPPGGPHGGGTVHSYYEEPWPPRASDDDYIEQPPPSRQGTFRPVRPIRYNYQPPPSPPPQASPHPMHSPMYYQPQQPRRPSHPTYTNDYCQPQSPPPQRSSRPPIKVNNIYRPQGSRPPFSNGYYQQSSPLPMDDEDYYYQNQTIPQASHRSGHDNSNGYNEQETLYFDDYYTQSSQISPQVSQTHVSNPQISSDDYYQDQLQAPPPRVHTNGYYQRPSRTPWRDNPSQWTQDNQLVNY